MISYASSKLVLADDGKYVVLFSFTEQILNILKPAVTVTFNIYNTLNVLVCKKWHLINVDDFW